MAAYCAAAGSVASRALSRPHQTAEPRTGAARIGTSRLPCFPSSSSTDRSSPRCCRSSSRWPAASRCSRCRSRSIPRSRRRRSRSRPSIPARTPRSWPTPSPRRSSSRSTASKSMLYMSSQCTNDGTYTLTVTFANGVDLNMAQVLVQNRVALAQPVLPDLVQRRGVTVKKKSPSMLMIVNLFSPDGEPRQPVPEQLRHDPAQRRTVALAGRRRHHLPRPARLQHAALARSRDRWPRATSRPATSCRPSSSRTCRSPPARSASRRSPNGQVFQYTMSTLGRLADPEQFADMILKTRSPTAGWSGCATSPASNWAPRATTRPARSTASPRWRCRSTSLPGSNALDVAEPVQGQDGRAQGALSRRRRLRDRLRHDAVHPGIDQRGVQDPARRRDPGGDRGAASSCRTGGRPSFR